MICRMSAAIIEWRSVFALDRLTNLSDRQTHGHPDTVIVVKA